MPFYGINPTKTRPAASLLPEHGRLPRGARDGGDGRRPRPHRGGGRGRAVGRRRARDHHARAGQRGRPGGPDGQRAASAPRIADAGIAMVGPNCMGVATPGYPSPWIGSLHPDLRARARWRPSPTPARSARSWSRSGPRVGFRTVVSAGNETVTDVADMIAYFADDPDCRVVGLFLETVRRPAAFEEALRRIAEAGKVAIVLKVGTVRDGRAGGARPHRGAGRGRPQLLRPCCATTTPSACDDFGGWIEHLEVFSRAKPRRAAGGSARSPTPAARASTSPTRPSRPASRCSSFSDELRQRITGRVPELRRTSATRPTAGRSTTTGSCSRACSS